MSIEDYFQFLLMKLQLKCTYKRAAAPAIATKMLTPCTSIRPAPDSLVASDAAAVLVALLLLGKPDDKLEDAPTALELTLDVTSPDEREL